MQKKGKERVLILGAGGHGKVILDALLAAGNCEVAGFADDDKEKWGREVLGYPVVGPCGDLSSMAEKLRIGSYALAIGDNYVRESLFRSIADLGLKVRTVIHPNACVSRFAALGRGAVVLAGAVVNAGTTVGDNVCINTRASIDHDNQLAYSCHVFPNATLAGNVTVGEFSYVGSAAVVIPGRTIGRFAYCGAGAVIIEDVAEGTRVVGVPAKTIGSQIARPLPVK